MDTLVRPTHDRPAARRRGSALLLANMRDAETTRKVVSAHIAPHHLVLPPRARVDVVLRRIHAGSFSSFTLAYGCPAELHLDRLRQAYLVLLAGAPGGALETDKGMVPLTPAIVSPEGRAVLRWPANAWVTMMVIPRRILERAAPAHWHDTIRFAPHMDMSHDAAGPWLALAKQFLGTAENSPIARSPQAMAAFEQLLIHGLFASQPSSARSDGRSRTEHLPPGLMRAVAYCEKQTAVPPTVAEIAAVAHMSVRTLQVHFQQHLGISPHAYLRTVRLARVHRELLAASDGRGGGTVTRIAQQNGFHHLGRFARLYRSQYGQMPSETLRVSAASGPARPGPNRVSPPATSARRL